VQQPESGQQHRHRGDVDATNQQVKEATIVVRPARRRRLGVDFEVGQ